MAAPDMRSHLESLIGQTLPTIRGRPNTVLAVRGGRVFVGTRDNPRGRSIRVDLLQGVVDRVYAGELVELDRRERSAFVAAVLQTIDDIEVLVDPRRAQLARRDADLRNPDWQYDELILALDLYLRWRPRRPAPEHSDVVRLSELLQRLPIHSPALRGTTFRNPNGVRRKLMDFTAPDPNYTGRSTNGGSGVHEVWARFAHDNAGRAAVVAAITAAATETALELPPEEGEEHAVEGRIVFRQHRLRERNASLIARKKAAALRQRGRLACEVCDVDFEEKYGPLGRGFIECHHTLPLASGPERTTTLADLALVCPNCHRMLHRARPALTPEELRSLLISTAREPASGSRPTGREC